MIPHCILFELANFHGAHRHVFAPEPNLAASYFSGHAASDSQLRASASACDCRE